MSCLTIQVHLMLLVAAGQLMTVPMEQFVSLVTLWMEAPLKVVVCNTNLYKQISMETSTLGGIQLLFGMSPTVHKEFITVSTI